MNSYIVEMSFSQIVKANSEEEAKNKFNELVGETYIKPKVRLIK